MRRIARDPAGYLRQLPRAVLRQPMKFLSEFHDLLLGPADHGLSRRMAEGPVVMLHMHITIRRLLLTGDEGLLELRPIGNAFVDPAI